MTEGADHRPRLRCRLSLVKRRQRNHPPPPATHNPAATHTTPAITPHDHRRATSTWLPLSQPKLERHRAAVRAAHLARVKIREPPAVAALDAADQQRRLQRGLGEMQS